MPVFPLFVDLKDKLCVVIGGGDVAARKIDVLLEFGAKIRVVSPGLSERLAALQQQGRIEAIKRGYAEGDLEGAFIAIAATPDSGVNEKVYEYAVKKGIFVDVADCPQKCTFIFPSIVRRGDLVVGISTSGGYPALSKNVRERIDAVLPQSYGSLLEMLKSCRRRAADEIPDRSKRKEALSRILDEMLLCEDALESELLKLRIEKIFKEYGNEEDNQSRKP